MTYYALAIHDTAAIKKKIKGAGYVTTTLESFFDPQVVHGGGTLHIEQSSELPLLTVGRTQRHDILTPHHPLKDNSLL